MTHAMTPTPPCSRNAPDNTLPPLNHSITVVEGVCGWCIATDTDDGCRADRGITPCSKGVLNEGHDTLPWAALNYITFWNDVRPRIAEKTISIFCSMKFHACIDLLTTAQDHTYREDISCSITSISSFFTPYIENYVDPLNQLTKFMQKNHTVTFVWSNSNF